MAKIPLAEARTGPEDTDCVPTPLQHSMQIIKQLGQLGPIAGRRNEPIQRGGVPATFQACPHLRLLGTDPRHRGSDPSGLVAHLLLFRTSQHYDRRSDCSVMSPHSRCAANIVAQPERFVTARR